MKVQSYVIKEKPLKRIFHQWFEENPTETRLEACIVIMKALEKQSSTIDLTDYQLPSLPDCFAYFPKLTTLKVDRTRFLPQSSNVLTKLTSLNIDIKSQGEKLSLMERFPSLQFLNDERVRKGPARKKWFRVNIFKR